MKNFFRGVMAVGMIVSAIASVIAMIIFWVPMYQAAKKTKDLDPGVEEIPDYIPEES